MNCLQCEHSQKYLRINAMRVPRKQTIHKIQVNFQKAYFYTRVVTIQPHNIII